MSDPLHNNECSLPRNHLHKVEWHLLGYWWLATFLHQYSEAEYMWTCRVPTTRTCVSTRIANRTDESGLSTDNGLRPITISWTGRRMTIVNRILPKSNRQTISINGADETFRTLLVSRLQSVGSGPGTILETDDLT